MQPKFSLLGTYLRSELIHKLVVALSGLDLSVMNWEQEENNSAAALKVLPKAINAGLR